MTEHAGGPVMIDDPADPRVAAYVGLTDAQLRRTATNDAPYGTFIAEGTLVIKRMLLSAYQPRSFLLTPARHADLADDLRVTAAPVFVADLDVMKSITGFNVHRGALAEAERRPPSAVADVIATATTVAVLEAINDFENLGAIFRNAAALGVDAVLMSPQCCDPLSRRAVRVSMGNVLSTPFARIESWPAGLHALTQAGFVLVALTPDPAATAIDLVAREHCKRALLLGAEGPGLTREVLAMADMRVRIPVRVGTDSLNVANAAAIAFHAFAKMTG